MKCLTLLFYSLRIVLFSCIIKKLKGTTTSERMVLFQSGFHFCVLTTQNFKMAYLSTQASIKILKTSSTGRPSFVPKQLLSYIIFTKFRYIIFSSFGLKKYFPDFCQTLYTNIQFLILNVGLKHEGFVFVKCKCWRQQKLPLLTQDRHCKYQPVHSPFLQFQNKAYFFILKYLLIHCFKVFNMLYYSFINYIVVFI